MKPRKTFTPGAVSATNPTVKSVTASKLRPCKMCGAEIAKNADKCPHCGAPQQSPGVRVVLIVVLVILVLMIARMIGVI
jgi:RNA polymerase subunit RPABC4/transcription elongation factor Spt4